MNINRLKYYNMSIEDLDMLYREPIEAPIKAYGENNTPLYDMPLCPYLAGFRCKRVYSCESCKYKH